jgi:hypothetical protein
MPTITLTERENLVIELAFTIEDPCGVEAIELANSILRVFENREGPEAEAMHQSLLQWSLQWPRVEKSPITRRSRPQNGTTEPCEPPCHDS